MRVTGRIIKGVGGIYTVFDGTNTYECFARGKIKLQRKLVIGDMVEFDPDTCNIGSVLPPKNILIRPPVANIDYLLIVIAASPKPDLLLVDKLLIFARKNNIEPILVFNKTDIDHGGILSSVFNQYSRAEVTLIPVSAKTGDNIAKFQGFLRGKVGCLSGQSAVGKSSIINALYGKDIMEVGDLSKKTERGRHTTRHAEILCFDGFMIADTPGFSLLELTQMTPSELACGYAEYAALSNGCKFQRKCLHINEPGCAVKEAVQNGELSPERYLRYTQIYKELKNKTQY